MAGGQERILRRRIKSVESTKKITRAMELIAASRIVKAQQRVAAAVPYSDQITEVVKDLAAADPDEEGKWTVFHAALPPEQRAVVDEAEELGGFGGGVEEVGLFAAEGFEGEGDAEGAGGFGDGLYAGLISGNSRSNAIAR